MADTPSYTIEQFEASDGYTWKYRKYAADAEKAHVVYLHGIQSHAGWYEYSCTNLADAGYTVSFLDRRGSGMNEQGRGDTPSFHRLIDDVAEYLQHMGADKSPRSTPIFLASVSWGGKTAVALQRKYPGYVDGLILMCPGFFPQVGLSFGQRVKIVGSRLVNPTRYYPIPLNDPELFTQTSTWLQFLRNDDLALHEATARFLVASAGLGRYLRRCPEHVTAPVLLMLAEKDRIIDNTKTRAYVESFATADKRIIEYEGAHHTLEFEPEPERFVGDLIGWLDEKC